MLEVVLFTHLWPTRTHPNTGVFVRSLAEALSTKCNLRVVAPAPLASVLAGAARPERNIARPWYIGIPKVGDRYESGLMNATCGSALRRAVKGADIVHAHFAYPDGAAALAAIRSVTSRPPTVLTVHGSDVHTFPGIPGLRSRISQTLASYDAVVAVSESLAASASDLSPEARVRVIPNGVDSDFLSACHDRMTDSVSPVLLYVGSLVRVKRVDRLVQAMRFMPAEWRLRIVGDGPCDSSLKSLARELGEDVSSRIEFLGALPHDRVADAMRAASVVALTSEAEGLPVVLLEAAAVATPWVALAGAGGNDVDAMLPGTGLAMRSSDPEDIADSVVRASALLRIPSKPFSWAEIADEYLGLYEQLLTTSLKENR